MFMQTKKGLLRVCFVVLLELAFYMSTVLYEDSITTVRLGSLEFMCTISRLRSSAEAKDFSSSLCVQTESRAHPASCPVGTGGPFPGVKRGRGVTLTTHSHLVLRSRMRRSYTSSAPSASIGVLWDCPVFKCKCKNMWRSGID
jgi:hypothetical protein